ncbi:hypothetical protein TNCV_526551 [Trichonephila clavipes]|nr:hypothetical protein TNCV_526551 [Trichonephila clavipes]
MIVLMNCQTKLRINHLTAVKSVAILESNANLNFYTWKKNTLYLRHGGTLNSRRAASPLVKLLEGELRWEAPDPPQGILPQNWDGTELNGTAQGYA